jgi:hypothetical protein
VLPICWHNVWSGTNQAAGRPSSKTVTPPQRANHGYRLFLLIVAATVAVNANQDWRYPMRMDRDHGRRPSGETQASTNGHPV